ncbi:MAG: glycosyltransferase family 4 protein [Candidatus Helarchaeota archaeon]
MEGLIHILNLVHNIYPLQIGGAELYSYNLSVGLSKLGHRVSICILNSNNLRFKQLNLKNNLSLYFFPHIFLGFLSILFNLFGFLVLTLRLFSKLKRIDIIQVHIAHYPMIAGFIISKIFHIPLIVTCHGSDIKLKRNKFGTRFIQNLIFNRCNHVVVVSTELKYILLSDLKTTPISIIPGGVDTEYFSVKVKERAANTPIQLLFVGSLRKVKNPQILLQAIEALKGNNHKINLTLIGDGPLFTDLFNFCEAHQITNVNFLKSIPHGNLQTYYETGDIFVMPSLSEGTPLALLEAMACAKPIIASNVGGIPDLIKNDYNGLLIEPQNVKQLLDKITFLIENPDFAKKIGINARRSVSSFSWDKICQKYLRIYYSTMKAHQVI